MVPGLGLPESTKISDEYCCPHNRVGSKNDPSSQEVSGEALPAVPGCLLGHPAQHPAGLLLRQVPVAVGQRQEAARYERSRGVVVNKLMTTDEVANLLSVKPATIRKWVHLEQIPVVRLGRAVRFKVEAVEKWVNERCQHARTWDL
jgi:excisionase family DNA binding protein